MKPYVHGYTGKEAKRLNDQSNSLEEILHYDSVWSSGELVLEAGCGTGAQTKIIAVKNPRSNFVSIDISEDSLIEARILARKLDIENVEFCKADIFNIPFEDGTFDHVFVCFVLEHLSNCIAALRELKRVLKISGTICVIEGDHGSTFFHPDSKEAHSAIQCQVELQKQMGGDANVGRKLFPLLKDAGFKDIRVSPRMVYVDGSRPELIEGFTRNTFTAMIEGIKDTAVSAGLIDETSFDRGINDLYNTAGENGVFCYTFFKAIAFKS